MYLTLKARLVFILMTSSASCVLAGAIRHVFAWPGYADEDRVQVFAKRYDADIEVTLMEADDVMWNRLPADKDVTFDVFTENNSQLQRSIDQGMDIPLTTSNIPNSTTQLSRFRTLDSIAGLTRAGRKYAIPSTCPEMDPMYDRKFSPGSPHTVSLMWGKRFQGLVNSLEHPATPQQVDKSTRLQHVEHVTRVKSRWGRIVSGEVMEAF